MAEARRLRGGWTRVVALLAALGATRLLHRRRPRPDAAARHHRDDAEPGDAVSAAGAGPAGHRTSGDDAGPRSCRHRPADFARPGLRGGHGDDARATAQPASVDARRRARHAARHRRDDVRAGREPAGHPRPERLSRPHPGERAGDRRRVGAERRSRRAHRSAGRRPGRGGARARPRCATARRRSAASSTPSTTASPPRSRPTASWSRRAAASARSTTAATAPPSSRRAPAISWSTPTPSRAPPATTAYPAGRRPTPASTARATRSAAPSCAKDGFVGVAYSIVRQHVLHSRHRGRREQEPHRAQPDEIHQPGRVARQRLRSRGHPLLVRRHRLQARRGGFRCRSRSIGSTFLQTTYEARMEAQHLPVRHRSGRAARRRRHAVVRIAICRRPAPTASC